MRSVLGGILFVSLCGTLAAGVGCSNTAPEPKSPKAETKAAPALASCERQHPGVGAERHSPNRQGGAVVLARHGEKTLAYIADEDSRAIHTFDVSRNKQIARTRVSGAPAQVLVLADGRVAATLKDRNRIQVLEPAAEPDKPLTSLCQVPVPTEPIGLAATPDDRELLVTSGWGAALTALQADTMKVAYSVELAREPRAVLVDKAGERAFVSHAIGAKVSVVDLKDKHKVRQHDMGVKVSSPSASAEQRTRSGVQGYALTATSDVIPSAQDGSNEVELKIQPAPKPTVPKGRVFAPMITVDPGDPNTRSRAYYGDGQNGIPKEVPVVAVLDASAERPITRSVVSIGSTMTEECMLPRAAAMRGNGNLLVSCLGADMVVELDGRGTDPMRLERRRWKVPAGPTGLAVDSEKDIAVVWSQFDGSVSLVNLKTQRVDTETAWYDPTPEVRKVALGRRIFHMTDDSRVSNDGVACASCHPDGREDSMTWSTPEGPRQTIMLAGRAQNTAPYGWYGEHGDLHKYLGNTFSRLGGSGIRGPELDSLVAYLEHLPGPPQQRAVKTAAYERGEQLFVDSELGCSTCHLGGAGVDKATHDVGSRATADTRGLFDTPSLSFVGGTGPYFHDGRYESLEDLLSSTDSEMGHTLHLSSRQRADLAAYLRSL